METNEYGVPLDLNGYAPSIMQKAERCFMCGRSGHLQRHELFGASNREKSKAYGLWILLCVDCHEYIHQKDSTRRIEFREHGQAVAMKHYGWSKQDFIERFGKNYL